MSPHRASLGRRIPIGSIRTSPTDTKIGGLACSAHGALTLPISGRHKVFVLGLLEATVSDQIRAGIEDRPKAIPAGMPACTPHRVVVASGIVRVDEEMADTVSQQRNANLESQHDRRQHNAGAPRTDYGQNRQHHKAKDPPAKQKTCQHHRYWAARWSPSLIP